jgi:hypothetical protein
MSDLTKAQALARLHSEALDSVDCWKPDEWSEGGWKETVKTELELSKLHEEALRLAAWIEEHGGLRKMIEKAHESGFYTRENVEPCFTWEPDMMNLDGDVQALIPEWAREGGE